MGLRTYEEVRRDILASTPVQFCVELEIIEGLMIDKGFTSLRHCLETPISKGGIGLSLDKVKEMLYFNPMYRHKADELSHKLGIVELAKSVPVLNDANTGGFSNGYKKENITNARGTSSEYRISKLKRDFPEIAERLMNCEFKSVSEAERAAGIGKPKMTNVERVLAAINRLSDDEKEELFTKMGW